MTRLAPVVAPWPPEVAPEGVGLYVHIPFCPCKCRYCDFASYVNREAWADRYFEVLFAELDAFASLPLRSVYLGGGTPSTLSVTQLDALIGRIRDRMRWPAGIEATFEANPATGGPELWRAARELGITRVSVGVQAFQAPLLRAMGRDHSVADVERIVAELRDARIPAVSLDLIYCLPGQTLAMWEETLAGAIALSPDHLSLYSLIVETDTAWGVASRKGKLALPPEEDEIAMARLADEVLASAGYVRYEFGSYGRPGHASVHNRIYWLNEPFVGVGVGAHSWLEGRRWGNPKDLRVYLEGGYPRVPIAPVGRRDEMAETVFLGLRMTAGLDLDRFARRYGVALDDAFPGVVDRFVAQGLLERHPDRIALTPRGMLLSNEVFVAFI